jgi:hypothetical protein
MTFHRTGAANYRSQVTLFENHPLRLTGAQGSHVTCVSGRVWITAYDMRADVELRPGETFIVPNQGLTLVEAIGICQVRVEPPPSPLSFRIRTAPAWTGFFKRTGRTGPIQS